MKKKGSNTAEAKKSEEPIDDPAKRARRSVKSRTHSARPPGPRACAFNHCTRHVTAQGDTVTTPYSEYSGIRSRANSNDEPSVLPSPRPLVVHSSSVRQCMSERRAPPLRHSRPELNGRPCRSIYDESGPVQKKKVRERRSSRPVGTRMPFPLAPPCPALPRRSLPCPALPCGLRSASLLPRSLASALRFPLSPTPSPRSTSLHERSCNGPLLCYAPRRSLDLRLTLLPSLFFSSCTAQHSTEQHRTEQHSAAQREWQAPTSSATRASWSCPTSSSS